MVKRGSVGIFLRQIVKVRVYQFLRVDELKGHNCENDLIHKENFGGEFELAIDRGVCNHLQSIYNAPYKAQRCS